MIHMYHHELESKKHVHMEYVWEEETKEKFNELIISWKAERPLKGDYEIYVSVYIDDWSKSLLYARWGKTGQRSFLQETTDVRTYQDALEVLNDKKASKFKIRILADEEANLDRFFELHVCASDLSSSIQANVENLDEISSVSLPLLGLSQMALPDVRNERICSPTSTTAVVRYLSQNKTIDPIRFAESSWDAGFDIFGNWVFNVAHANEYLLNGWSCWVERLSGFRSLYDSLSHGIPVVISIRGPLERSAKPYNSGHLIVVKGYDAKTKEVLCMDPAFLSDEKTEVRYQLEDLMKAWERRKCVSYVFKKVE